MTASQKNNPARREEKKKLWGRKKKKGAIFKVHSHSKGASVVTWMTLRSSWPANISKEKDTFHSILSGVEGEAGLYSCGSVDACDKQPQKWAPSGKNQGSQDQDEIMWLLYGQCPAHKAVTLSHYFMVNVQRGREVKLLCWGGSFPSGFRTGVKEVS